MPIPTRLRSLLLAAKQRLKRHHRTFFFLRNLMLKLKMHRFLHAVQGKDMPVPSGAHYVRLITDGQTVDYSQWSAVLDTPPEAWIKRETTKNRLRQPIEVVIQADHSNTEALLSTLESLLRTIGYPWRATVIAQEDRIPSLSSAASARFGPLTGVSFGHTRPATDAGPVLLVTGTPVLSPHCLVVMMHYMTLQPDVWLAYSDECQAATEGTTAQPWFKPSFSPMLAQQGALMGRVCMVNTAVPDVSDWFANIRHDACWETLLPNLACKAGKGGVLHIPHVLYADPEPPRVNSLTLPTAPANTRVSVVIPTRDRWDLLGPCIKSLLQTDWPRECLDILVIDNGSTDKTTLDALAEYSARGVIRVIRDDGIFNWARLNNAGAAHCSSELLVFLNNDTEVIDHGWLKKIAGIALQEGVGAVGCKLLYADRTVQHAGVILGIQGLASHAHLYLGEREPGYRGLANMTREVSAVTGACLGVTKVAFDRVGGFREVLRVAFNDVVFCLDLLEKGYRNVCIADALFLHFESKTRGYDDTAEKVALLLKEARTAWTLHKSLLKHDPCYSPNLSLERPYEISFAPRMPRPWAGNSKNSATIMLLSCTHAVGHGVAVVVALHAEALVKAGFRVIVAGHRSDNDYPYPDCEWMDVEDPRDAAFLAAQSGVDLVIAHTPPFFSIARWTGAYPKVIAYDYGEPPCDWFPDATQRRQGKTEKEQVLVMADRVYAISDAVAAESLTPVTGVIPLGNSHLGCWNGKMENIRARSRKARGWTDSFVVLNVCRFHEGERQYKGVDTYVKVMQAAKQSMKNCIFVQAGKGSPADTLLLRTAGLEVHANITDMEMTELYCAADAYLNFSRWEGYNLGIGQALAMGLPALASDIPAHRAFQIPLADEVSMIMEWLKGIQGNPPERTANIQPWDDSLGRLIEVVKETLESKGVRHEP